jgi:hypothetical protein
VKSGNGMARRYTMRGFEGKRDSRRARAGSRLPSRSI